MSNLLLSKRMNTWWTAAARGFEALRIRNFRLFWIGQVISVTGTWMQTTAQAWLVLKLTDDSPLALGTVITLQFLPVLLFALYGGVLADRLPKRHTLMLTQSLFMLQATIFATLVATGVIQLWQVYVLAVTQGLITAIDNPLRQAFLFEMVGRKDIVNAVGLNSMTFQGARIFGPAMAGVVIQLIGIAPTLILNALSYIPVIWALRLMDASTFYAAPLASGGSIWKNLKEGIRYAVHTPTISSILIVVAFIGTFGYNFTVVTPLVADHILQTDAAGFGLLSAAMGVGAFIAAIGTAYARTITMRRMLISGTLFSALLGTLALSTSFPLSMLLFTLTGIAGVTCATATNSLLQLNTSEQLRGRVLSINVLLAQGSTVIGASFLGGVGQAAGVSMAILACAALCLIGVTLAVSYRWQQARSSALTRHPTH